MQSNTNISMLMFGITQDHTHTHMNLKMTKFPKLKSMRYITIKTHLLMSMIKHKNEKKIQQR